MKASEITLGNGDILIENTNDSYNRWPVKCYDGQAFHRDRYIRQNGDVVVVWDEKHKAYRVPEFKTQRDSYKDAKAVDCARWGNE